MNNNLILAIDTSCDETSAAVTDGRRVLSNVISSQIDIHKKYGGVYPVLAKRAHEERIDYVVNEALKQACRQLHKSTQKGTQINTNCSNSQSISVDSCSHSCGFVLNAVAVTQGPGLAIALEVGIRKAKKLCGWEMGSESGNESGKWVEKSQTSSSFSTPDTYLTSHPHPKLIAINHLEGHIYSCFAQNNSPSPLTPDAHPTSHPDFEFPALCLIVSGGHTQLTLMKDHGIYETIGQTLDDACGEALDKAAKILKLGYPGGPIIEKLAEKYINECGWEVGSVSRSEDEKWVEKSQTSSSHPTPDTYPISHPHPNYQFNSPLPQKSNLNFSYSGLKTQLLYLVNSLAENEFNENLNKLAYSFQSVCFDQIVRKTSEAIKIYQPKLLICGGGVIANKYLRKILRQLAKKYSLKIYFPPNKKLVTDNAAMIGVAAYYHFLRKDFIENPESLEREPRLAL